MMRSEVGEDLVAHCAHCNYSANVEAANFLLSESLRKLVREGTLPSVLPKPTGPRKE